MSKIPLIIVFIIFTLMSSCTKSGIRVAQSDPKNWEGLSGWALLGERDSTGIQEKLCGTDLGDILMHTSLTPEAQKKMRNLLCGENASPEKFKAFYKALSEEDRLDLIRAFELFGYHVNEYG